jgi:putrescine transport system substrate-binding protein
MRQTIIGSLLTAALATALTVPAAADEVHLYSWSDYIGSKAIPAFTSETGTKVVYDVFDSNDLAETKLLAGKSGYDLVTPNVSPHFARQLAAGVWAPLDKSKLGNIGNIDAEIMKKFSAIDPGSAHGIPWMWGTTGIIFNAQKVREIMPDAPVTSWKLLFDPNVIAKFKKCGVVMLDDAEQVLGSVLISMGKPADTENEADLAAAVDVITKIRPFVSKFHSSEYMDGLANGEYCVVLGFSGDARVAALRSKEAKSNFDIQYRIPEQGALVYIDVLAVPKDAPNPARANDFINTLMRPEIAVAAAIETGFATANAEAKKLVPQEITSDPNLYPTPEIMAKLTLPKVQSPKVTRMWQKAWQKAMGQR